MKQSRVAASRAAPARAVVRAPLRVVAQAQKSDKVCERSMDGPAAACCAPMAPRAHRLMQNSHWRAPQAAVAVTAASFAAVAMAAVPSAAQAANEALQMAEVSCMRPRARAGAH